MVEFQKTFKAEDGSAQLGEAERRVQGQLGEAEWRVQGPVTGRESLGETKNATNLMVTSILA